MKVILLIFFEILGCCLCSPFQLKHKRSTSLDEASQIQAIEFNTPSSDVNNNNIRWERGFAGNHSAPEDGVECGYDGDYVTYVARAQFEGNTIPGKVNIFYFVF